MIKLNSKISQTTTKDPQNNSLFLPLKLKPIQSNLKQFEDRNEMITLTIDEIVKQKISIVISGFRGQGKTTFARQIEKQIKSMDKKQQIKAAFFSAKNDIQSDFLSMLKHYSCKKKQKQDVKKENDHGKLEVIIIIDDFDVILLQDHELLQNMKGCVQKQNCKFIYFVNSSIRKHQAYKSWIHLENMLYQYEMMQFNKSEVKNYFRQYIPWDECLSNMDLSQNLNNDIIKSIVQKVQNFQNIHDILIKIIKLSSIVDNLEQEAGNAMMILKELRLILQNQDFSFIRIKNSSFEFLSFHKCNLEGSQMENVDISRCWLISCNLNNVQWHNMVKHEVQFNYNIFKNKKVELVVFLNNKQIFAVGFENLIIELWHIKACKRLAIFRNDKDDSNFYSNYNRIAFSSNKILIVSLANSAKLKITSCQNGKIIRKLNQILSDNRTCPIAFSHDNQLLSVGVEEIIYIWNIGKGQKIIELKGNSNEIRELQFSSDDKSLASCSRDYIISTWNIKQRQQQKIIKKLKEFSQKFQFSQDLKYLASIRAGQNQIVVLDLISEFEIRKNLNNKNAKITDIIFSPTGKYIACSLKGGAVTLFQLINEKKFNQQKINTRTQSKSEFFEIVKTKDWNQSKISDSFEKNEIISLNFSTSESQLISGNIDGTIKFHDLQDKAKLQQNNGKFYCLAFSRSGKIIAFGSFKKEIVFIFDLEQGILLTELTTKNQKKVCFRAISFSFDGQLLAYSYDHRVMLWNLKTRELMSNIEHEDFVQEAIFSPTELILASCCSYRMFILIWSVEIPKQVVLRKRINSCNIIIQIAFSPCGKFLAQGGFKFFCLWDIQQEKMIKKFEAQEEHQCYKTIAFSPDGKVLASGGIDEITLWNIKQGNKIFSIEESTNYIKFSPNGQLLASAMKDSTIKIWDISKFLVSQDPIVLTGHSQEADSLDFSQDGTMLASSSYYDGQILIWYIQTENSNELENSSQENQPKQFYSITPFYAFTSDFSLNANHSSLKDAQIYSDKGVNLIQLCLQTGGKR